MKILAYAKGENPYQELLYAQMRAKGDTVTYLAHLTPSATLNLIILLPRILMWRLRGYRVFHLHWANALTLMGWPWNVKLTGTLLYWHYCVCLKVIKLLGYKLVWTAHNVLPHEPTFIDDIAARRKLVEAADWVIFHSDLTRQKLRGLGIIPKNSAIIPHGSYVGVYPYITTRKVARQKLGLKSSKFVYAYVGYIKPYKGVDTLLRAYAHLKSEEIELVVAGSCHDTGLRQALQTTKGVIWHDGHVLDKDLQYYFAAADVIVLPFRAVSTSGSALLALSFGKAVIVPNLGDLAQLPDSIAYKYSPATSDNALAKAMEAARNKDMLREKNHRAQQYADELAWPAIAEQTHAAIANLFK
jgi:glycosyltransferase involved in cell wall biosynthesis